MNAYRRQECSSTKEQQETNKQTLRQDRADLLSRNIHFGVTKKKSKLKYNYHAANINKNSQGKHFDG